MKKIASDDIKIQTRLESLSYSNWFNFALKCTIVKDSPPPRLPPPKKKSATSSGKKSFLASVPVRPILDDVLDGSHGRALKLFNDDNGRNVAASVRDVHDVVWTLVR